MYSCRPPHMANQKQDYQLEHTYSSYVMIRDVTLKTCQRRWMIGGRGERGSGMYVLATRHDDDDDDFSLVQYCSQNSCLFSIHLVSVHVVHPYSSIDTTAACILSVRSDFHMTDSQSIAVHAFASLVSPGGSSCTATYHPSRKLSKLDELDMQDTAEVGTSSLVMYTSGPLHMNVQRSDDQLEHTYSSSVPIRHVALEDLPEAMDDRKGWLERVATGISVLIARRDDHDDDDDVISCWFFLWNNIA